MHYLSWIIICWSFWVGKQSFTLLSLLRHTLYDVNSRRCLHSQNIEYAAYWRVGVRWQVRRKAAQSSFHSMRGVTQVKRSSNLLCTLSIKDFESKHHNHRVLPHWQLPPFTSVTYTFRSMLWTIFFHTKTKKTKKQRRSNVRTVWFPFRWPFIGPSPKNSSGSGTVDRNCNMDGNKESETAVPQIGVTDLLDWCSSCTNVINVQTKSSVVKEVVATLSNRLLTLVSNVFLLVVSNHHTITGSVYGVTAEIFYSIRALRYGFKV